MIKAQKTRQTAICLSILAFFPFVAVPQSWVEDSFEDFRDGQFDDAGANMYVSAKGEIKSVNRWDVNNDGYIDILFPNSHPLKEMLDLSIYWGNGKDFSIRNHSYVPANGPQWIKPADLNEDGVMDLVVANYSNGTWTSMDSAIYWGGSAEEAKGSEWAFDPFVSRTMLPSQNCQNAVVKDIDRDGDLDIVFAFSGGYWEYRSSESGSVSRIYTSEDGEFDRERFLDIPTDGATDVDSEDLNRDGWPDLVFASGDGEVSQVYIGGESGFGEEAIELPTRKASAVEIADVNGDGWLDILFANENGEESWVYLSADGEFDASRRIAFPTYTSKDVVCADFNNDGFADVFYTNHQYSLSGDPLLANRLINSYLFWGSADGFDPERRTELPTIGAWGAAAADLNEDGWVDLLVNNFQEHYSYEVPSFIYWNGPDGFSMSRRTSLYEHGSHGNPTADLNGDGHLDIVMTSMIGRSRGDYDSNYLYFGNAQGEYSVDRRIDLPGREAYEQAMADLDDDGAVDILLQNQGEVTRLANELWIYWNQDNEFTTDRITGLASYKGLGVQIADLDSDGYIDIVISNYFPEPGRDDPYPGLTVYWGSADGYVTLERTSIPIIRTRSLCIADMNGDGYLDLICGKEDGDKPAMILYGDGGREFTLDRSKAIEGATATGTPDVADLDRDGFLDVAFAGSKVLVYYGDADNTYTRQNMIPVQAKTMTIADVNQDGWLDLLCPMYKEGGNRSGMSTILLGSDDGFDQERRIDLPTDGGTGSMVSDFNFDGYTDVFFWCHRYDGSDERIGAFGDHLADSFLYYGSADGFSVDNRGELPGRGVHYDVGTDIGHIRNRGMMFVYTSSVFESAGKKISSIEWDATLPNGTAMKFQVKAAASPEDLDAADWVGTSGTESYLTDNNRELANPVSGDYFQYRAFFDTGNGANSPVLDRVAIEFTN